MNTVISRFDSRHDAERAVSSLRSAGFDEAEITLSDADAPRWRDGAADRSSTSGRLVPVTGGLLGAIIGAFVAPFALSIPLASSASQSAAIAMCTGACIFGVFASRIASALVTDDDDAPRDHDARPATPKIIGVRAGDGFSGRARRILSQSGGRQVHVELF